MRAVNIVLAVLLILAASFAYVIFMAWMQLNFNGDEDVKKEVTTIKGDYNNGREANSNTVQWSSKRR